MDDLGGKTPLFLGNIPNPMKNKNRLSPFVFGRKLCSYVASVRYFDKKKAVTMIDVTVFTHSWDVKKTHQKPAFEYVGAVL